MIQHSDVVAAIGNQTYVKEVLLGDEKIIFYYNNKASAQGGGVFVYRCKSTTVRPDKQADLKDYIATGKTSNNKGIPYYTMNLHKTLFDTKNKLF